MENTIKDKLNSIINQKLKLSKLSEEIGENEDLSDYGLNSISIIRLIIAMEEEFSIEVDDEELTIEPFKTIGNILAFINSKINDK
jgi:acyl carrier protein